MEANPKYSESFKRAGSEACSLITEGYVMKVQQIDNRHKQGYMMLKHKRNGNIIHIYVTQTGYSITKNGQLIKRELV